MRELPQKEDPKEQPGVSSDTARRSCPTDERRHGARCSTQQSTQRRLPLQRRINQQISQQGSDGQQSRYRVDRRRQKRTSGGTQREPKPEGLLGIKSARDQRPIRSTPHVSVIAPLHPLI